MIGEAKQTSLPVQVSRAGYGELIDNRSLTRKEKAVLRVLMDPTHADKTNEERMAIAGVSNATWYVVVRDPFVQRKQREMAQEFIRDAIAPMLKQSVKVATTAERDGFNDRKLLMEMSGFYVPRQQTDITSGGQPIVGVVGVQLDQV